MPYDPDQHARRDQRPLVLATGPAPIDRILTLSGVTKTSETTADPATLESPASSQRGDLS